MSIGAVRLSRRCVQWGSAEAQRQPPCEVIGARHPPARRDRHGPSRCAARLRGRNTVDAVGGARLRSTTYPERVVGTAYAAMVAATKSSVAVEERSALLPPRHGTSRTVARRPRTRRRGCAASQVREGMAWSSPRFGAGLATRCRLLLVMLASPCRTSELLARARAASGRGAVPGRRRADVADVDTVDARCPRPRRRPPRLRGATGPRRAASRARLGCPLACGGSFEEAASAVLTGLPRGNAKRPSERARASKAARLPPSTASEKVTPHFPSCRALQLTTSKLDSRAALPRWEAAPS